MQIVNTAHRFIIELHNNIAGFDFLIPGRRIRNNFKDIYSIFFFNDTATTDIYTLSLHDALPISYKHSVPRFFVPEHGTMFTLAQEQRKDRKSGSAGMPRPISYAVFCLKKKNKIRYASNDQQHTTGFKRLNIKLNIIR